MIWSKCIIISLKYSGIKILGSDKIEKDHDFQARSVILMILGLFINWSQANNVNGNFNISESRQTLLELYS